MGICDFLNWRNFAVILFKFDFFRIIQNFLLQYYLWNLSQVLVLMRESAAPCSQYYSLFSSLFILFLCCVLIILPPRVEIIKLLFILTNTFIYSNYILLLLLLLLPTPLFKELTPFVKREFMYSVVGPVVQSV